MKNRMKRLRLALAYGAGPALIMSILGGCQTTVWTKTPDGERNNRYTTVMIPSLGGGAPAITILEVNGQTSGVWAGDTLLSEVAGGAGAAVAGFGYDAADDHSTTTLDAGHHHGLPKKKHSD